MAENTRNNLWLDLHTAILYLTNVIFKSITFKLWFLSRWNHFCMTSALAVYRWPFPANLKIKPCLSELNCESWRVLWIWIEVLQFALSDEIYRTDAECLSLWSEAWLIAQLSCCSVKGLPEERERDVQIDAERLLMGRSLHQHDNWKPPHGARRTPTDSII